MLSKAQLKAAAGCAAGFLLGVSTMFLLLRVRGVVIMARLIPMRLLDIS